MQFDESKHPRADDGKFTDGNGTGKKAYDSQDKFGNMVRELPQGARDAIDKKIEQLEQEQRIELPKAPVTVVKAKDVTLTKSQWARYYKTLGEIQAGLYNPMQTLDGGNAILIDNMLILDNGSFISPRVKSIIVAKNEQYLLDYLEVCRTIGVLKWE
jgi:hypothetical protein